MSKLFMRNTTELYSGMPCFLLLSKIHLNVLFIDVKACGISNWTRFSDVKLCELAGIFKFRLHNLLASAFNFQNIKNILQWDHGFQNYG